MASVPVLASYASGVDRRNRARPPACPLGAPAQRLLLAQEAQSNFFCVTHEHLRDVPSFPTRRSSDLTRSNVVAAECRAEIDVRAPRDRDRKYLERKFGSLKI